MPDVGATATACRQRRRSVRALDLPLASAHVALGKAWFTFRSVCSRFKMSMPIRPPGSAPVRRRLGPPGIGSTEVDSPSRGPARKV